MAYVRLCALAFVACAVPAAACGGATDTGLFDGTGSDASTSAPATSSSVDASANSAPVKDAAAPPDTTPDASKSVTPDAAHPVTPDAAPPATIACGQGAGCDPAKRVCCLPATNSGNGNGSTSAPTCESSSDCTKSGGAPVACGNAADCAAAGAPSGSVCCVTEDPQSGIAVNTTCVDPTACTADTQAQVCDPNAAGSCPSGTTCTASMKTIPGYSICR